MSSCAVHWFRQDLRLADNPALSAACADAAALVCVYIMDDRIGLAQRWWLHHSLESLDERLRAKGQRLLLLQGDPAQVIQDLVERLQVDHVSWNRVYHPDDIERDKTLRAQLIHQGVEVTTCNGSLGREPWEVTQDKGKPYKVYTPYAKAWFRQPSLPVPLPEPDHWPKMPNGLPQCDRILSWHLLPTAPDWSAGLRSRWADTVGEPASGQVMAAFVDDLLADYGRARDLPGLHGTSRMSPHLHLGELSARQLVHAVQSAVQSGEATDGQAFPYLRQIVWRDFAHATMFHFPHLLTAPLRPEFQKMAWAEDPDGALLRAWQQGRTGYPIVDAGMRELWQTGWLHNRARLIVGSFLTKDLRLSWLDGAAWFMDTLVDADAANNMMGWQWVAGCGIDAAPYFRVFNPVLQGNKFDPQGEYVRRWVPELAGLPDRHLHAPWLAPSDVLQKAGVTMGGSYPLPIVDHGDARDAALAAYRALRTRDLPGEDEEP